MEFEQFRLNMMLEQYPRAGWMRGEVVFFAEDEEHRISHATWTFEDDDFAWLSESGFKLHLMELLDQFIQYRGSHCIEPMKKGHLNLGDRLITIEWLDGGTTHHRTHERRYTEDK